MLRVDAGGRSLVFSGDTGWHDALPDEGRRRRPVHLRVRVRRRRSSSSTCRTRGSTRERARFRCGAIRLTHLGSQVLENDVDRVEFDTAARRPARSSCYALRRARARSGGVSACPEQTARAAPVAAGRFEGSPRLAQWPSTAKAIASSASLGTPCASVVSSCAGARRARERARRARDCARRRRTGSSARAAPGRTRSAARATLSTVSRGERREHVVGRAAAREHRVARALEEGLAEALVAGALGRRRARSTDRRATPPAASRARVRARRARRRGRSARAPSLAQRAARSSSALPGPGSNAITRAGSRVGQVAHVA